MPIALDDHIIEPSSYTSPYLSLFGKFQLSNTVLPYFQILMPLRDVKSDLRLVEELTPAKDKSWSLSELFQREIDYDRVRKDLVTGYLKNKDKRVFFNSLTVALLPLSDAGDIDETYIDPEKLPNAVEPFGFPKKYRRQNQIGGIQIAAINENSPVGYLRWDRNSIFAATIDGQHRLAALREIANGLTKPEHQETLIPIIILILDPKVGLTYASSQAADGSILELVREVFIDINKHAKQVGLCRQILLDDIELESICTKTLVAKESLTKPDNRVPLGLVNWKDSTVKFDKGPYFTAIPTIHSLVKFLLALKWPSDPYDEGEVQKFLDSFDRILRIQEEIDTNQNSKTLYGEYATTDFKKVVMKKRMIAEDEPAPLISLPVELRLAAANAFKQLYRPLFIRVFGEFSQYKSYWELSDSLGGLDAEMAVYFSETKSNQAKLKESWGEEKFKSYIEEPLNRLEGTKNNNWPFYVVFQKGLFKATFRAKEYSNDSLEIYLNKWIRFLNDLANKRIFNVDLKVQGGEPYLSGAFWEGICLNPTTYTIQWSDAASNRIASLLLLFWYFSNNKQSPKQFTSELNKPESNREYPGGKSTMKFVVGHLAKLAFALQENPDLSEKEVTKLGVKRLHHLLKRVEG